MNTRTDIVQIACTNTGGIVALCSNGDVVVMDDPSKFGDRTWRRLPGVPRAEPSRPPESVLQGYYDWHAANRSAFDGEGDQ